MMRAAGDSPEGVRLRALIVVLWRAGLRISEALALSETDLDARRGAVVRHGKGDKRREVGMDPLGVEALQPWQELRRAAGRRVLLRDPRADRGTRLGGVRVRNSYAPRCKQASAAGLPRISCGTPTPSKWHTRACR